MAALWIEPGDEPPVIYDGLGDEAFAGWEPRVSASARLMALGVGVLVGLALAYLVAPAVAGWLS